MAAGLESEGGTTTQKGVPLTPRKRAASRRGRPSTEIALATRNRLWAWAVLQAGDVSWDRLDQQFLGATRGIGEARPRAFWTIARHGIDPITAMRTQQNVFLVDVVGRAPGFESTAELYRSPLWRMLKPPGLDGDQLYDLQNVLLDKYNLFLAEGWNRTLGNWVLPGETAFHPAAETSPDDAVELLAIKPSLDLVALFLCAFRLAIEETDFLDAHVYLGAARRSLNDFLATLSIPEQLAQDLKALLYARLVRGSWEIVDRFPEGTAKRVRHGKLGQQAAVGAGLDVMGWHGYQRGGNGLIVPWNANVSWFFEHYKFIERAYGQAMEAKDVHVAELRSRINELPAPPT